jgi:hypothetical protein
VLIFRKSNMVPANQDAPTQTPGLNRPPADAGPNYAATLAHRNLCHANGPASSLTGLPLAMAEQSAPA